MPDKRTKKTEKLIKNSFYELAKEYPVENITVKMICDKAEISRSTFYDYFESYPYLLDQLTEELLQDYLNLINLYHYDTNSYPFLSEMVNYTLENNYRLFLLYRKDGDTSKAEKIYDIIKEKTIPIWLEESDCTKEQAELIYLYFSKGIDALMHYYYEHPETDKEMFLDLVEKVVKYGVYDFIYTK